MSKRKAVDDAVVESSLAKRARTNINSYTIFGHIASGRSAHAFLAKDTVNNRIVAIKIKKDNVTLTDVDCETEILRQLDHPNIITLFDTHFMLFNNVPFPGTTFTANGCYHALVFEYIPYNLTSCRDLSGGQVKSYAYQLLAALDHCHSKNIIHRDIKPDNILLIPVSGKMDTEANIIKLTSGEMDTKTKILKLANFGCASENITDSEVGHIQCLHYRAPEVLLAYVPNVKTLYDAGKTGLVLSDKADVWAAGCIIAEMYMSSMEMRDCGGRRDYFLFTSKLPTALDKDKKESKTDKPTTADLYVRQLEQIFALLGKPTVQTWPELVELPGYDTLMNFDEKSDICPWLTLRERLPIKDVLLLDLVSQLLHVNPKKRISARDAMNHPYFDTGL